MKKVIIMLVSFQILVNKLITLGCKITKKNGTVLPGTFSYNIRQNILEKIKYPKYVIGVTGSSGKGTTTNLIAHILKSNGYDVVYNESGSNGIRGITTTILNNCTIFGRFKHDILLLELDEKHLHLAFGKNKMTHLVITNITRDQPARNGSPDLIYDAIFNALDGSTTLILNGDDPGLMKAKLNYPGKIITYGLEKTIDSFTKVKNNNIDNAYCPKCHKKLIYKFYHYGHIGSYFCKNCNFTRGNLDFVGKNIDLQKKSMKINGLQVSLNKDILYEAYSTIAAFALTSTIGIETDKILYALNEDIMPPKRGNSYNYKNKSITLLESKNENALSYYQSLKYIIDTEGKKSVVLGFDNVSRRYKFNDISWLWDVDFELLNNSNIDKIFCIGRFKYDVANRLIYANIDPKKIILIEDVNDILSIITNETKYNIYTMVCFDMTGIIKKQILEANNGNN
jgi:UDP-N-acetylmuramyl tripeptide synthase